MNTLIIFGQGVYILTLHHVCELIACPPLIYCSRVSSFFVFLLNSSLKTSCFDNRQTAEELRGLENWYRSTEDLRHPSAGLRFPPPFSPHQLAQSPEVLTTAPVCSLGTVFCYSWKGPRRPFIGISLLPSSLERSSFQIRTEAKQNETKQDNAKNND